MKHSQRKRLTKGQSERIHARRRAFERYGIHFNGDVNKIIVSKIQSGAAKLIRKQSLRVSVWDVMAPENQLVRVVYDRERKQIVTFLPMECLEEQDVLEDVDKIEMESFTDIEREFLSKGDTL